MARFGRTDAILRVRFGFWKAAHQMPRPPRPRAIAGVAGRQSATGRTQVWRQSDGLASASCSRG